MQVYYSYLWREPYCYTIPDFFYCNKPVEDKTGIIDGGFFIYKELWRRKELLNSYINYLIESKVRFILGFDNAPKEVITKVERTVTKKANSEYIPILKSKDSINQLKEYTAIATNKLDIAIEARKRDIYVHWLGFPKQEQESVLNFVDSVDVNPYQNNKRYIIKVRQLLDPIINVSEQLDTFGEFVLYGSSLFTEKYNDIDILYYGSYSEDDIVNLFNNSKNINIVHFTKNDKFSARYSHLLFAIDNGYPLTPIIELEKKYKYWLDLTRTKYYNGFIRSKSFLAHGYNRAFQFDKEFKTLITLLYYTNPENSLLKLIWDNLHLFYRVFNNDRKAKTFVKQKLLETDIEEQQAKYYDIRYKKNLYFSGKLFEVLHLYLHAFKYDEFKYLNEG